MFFLSDLSTVEFGRKRGSKNKKLGRTVLGKLGRSIWNANTAGAAANGAQIGGAVGLLTSNPKNTFRRTLIGTAAGLGSGTALGIASQYRNQNK
ncbi:hypothetical protein [Scytonema sp. NUACC26]|uniref:hypothetical protein n=1 Tax=Scytonema sp. NUACC26 TaxID=3140176 RepID=UPI0034DCA828